MVRPSENRRMSMWVEPPTLNLTLWHDSLLVAHLNNVFPHQGTWFADYVLSIDGRTDEHSRRILEYMSFCKDFNRRIASGDDHDFNEFDRFQDVSDCSHWRATLPNGLTIPMEGQLGFIDEQVTWQHPETQPSTEMAANELWARAASSFTGKQP
ncbi:MAG: hypothetical protein R3C59_27435 [Planctomycetaceae bacterium]